MPTKRTELVNNEIYHIVLRGVADSNIFTSIDDYYRCIFSIYEFNTKSLVEIRKRRQKRKTEKACGGSTPADSRDFLVEVLAFCFMPNHIHLLLRQLKNNGISKFMQKFGTGYTVYFNTKYNRKGHLFQGKFKAVHIENNEHLKTVFVYIHCNPLSLVEPGWKEMGIKELRKAMEFLENYKWSSYQDYIGKKNFPSVTNRDFVSKTMDGEQGCKKFVNGWIKHKKELRDIPIVSLE